MTLTRTLYFYKTTQPWTCPNGKELHTKLPAGLLFYEFSAGTCYLLSAAELIVSAAKEQAAGSGGRRTQKHLALSPLSACFVFWTWLVPVIFFTAVL